MCPLLLYAVPRGQSCPTTFEIQPPDSCRGKERTTIRARSARKRSCERSNGRPPASHAVRATASSAAPQVGRKAGDGRQVALDLALSDEDPAPPAARPPDDTAALEVAQRGPDRRARHAQALRELPLRTDTSARPGQLR